MLKIAICEDESYIREYLNEVLKKEFFIQADTYENGEKLLKIKKQYDILLLDICLKNVKSGGKINGLQLAKEIRKTSDAIIIFITALKEYVYDAYDVEAFHYLLKPIDEKKFRDVMHKAIEKIKKEKTTMPLMIKFKGSSHQIPIEEIYYAENDARKIILHTKRGEFSYYEKMEILESQLGRAFFRCHRGYLVHLQEVSGYDHVSIRLKNGDVIYMAKKKYADFVTAYMKYLTER